MTFRFLIAAFALTVATDVEAGPFRRRAQQATYQPTYPSAYQPAYQPVGQAYPSLPVTAPAGEYVASYTPAVAASDVPFTISAPADSSIGDGLDEVNAKRAARGLR